MSGKLILAIPNGSLYESTLAMLSKVGIGVVTNGRKFEARIEGSDIFDRAIVMRPQDMAEALVDGMVDVAIFGRDWLAEVGLGDQLITLAELNYSKKTNQPVKIVIFSKQSELVDREGILVTTEYPMLTSSFFKKATIRFSHGGTEQKVAFGKYDYGVCVTETGDSLSENGLVIVKTILVSPTILVTKNDSQELSYFASLLVGALRSSNLRLLKMNVHKDLLEKIISVLPALEAPTVNQLSNGDYALETIVPKTSVANLMVELQGKGVSGILSQEIEIAC